MDLIANYESEESLSENNIHPELKVFVKSNEVPYETGIYLHLMRKQILQLLLAEPSLLLFL